MFWSAGNYAQEVGRLRAVYFASSASGRPPLVLLSAARLALERAGVTVTASTGPPGHGSYRYRYDGFWLLTENSDRLDLLPHN